jgi:uncharacterized protein YbcC (UPF0753/DUF2309 family)
MTATTLTLKQAGVMAVPHDDPQAPAASARLTAERRRWLEQVADRACRRISPLWPLQQFVAVNPFLGLTGQSFEQAARTHARVTGATMTLPRAFYRQQIASGRIADRDLAEALARTNSTMTVDDLKRAARTHVQTASPSVATVADVLQLADGERWLATVVEEIAKWCGAYFDEGQAAWPMPWRDEPLYPAWRAAALIDRTPQALGLPGFGSIVRSLPVDPLETIDVVLTGLALAEDSVDDYLHRALSGIGGWAAWARHQVWQKELYGGRDAVMMHLLAVRLAWDWVLYRSHAGRISKAWRSSVAQAAAMREAAPAQLDADLLLQQAFEIAVQRELLAKLTARVAPADAAAGARKAVQAVFCIDVRSEVFRRQLEAVSAEVETFGFAGFFGFPIEYVPLGESAGGAQCPVLLTPSTRIREGLLGADAAREEELATARTVRRRAAAAWKSFKLSAVSCFAFVEASGRWYAAKLLGDSLGLTRPVPMPAQFGLGAEQASQVGPRIELEDRDVDDGDGRDVRLRSGFAPAARVDAAATVLGAMSLSTGFARLVLLAGHGSTTVNNPHASGLDCGACGGHTGQANARVAAAILNDVEVRRGLAARGIAVPQDTWFIAGQHDTTTDEVALFDTHAVPASHGPDLVRLQQWLQAAGARARLSRWPLLGTARQPEPAVHKDIVARSRDWSQVRPEWGLAGNIAFVAAPRQRTRGLDLGGRAFLHSYEWRADRNFAVLELIMTAPMVVANWINLQYYGSTVDNAAFGSGNKVLHNVLGAGLGVLEGNGGDLRTGLPWQSVHDGSSYVHEPVRLSVFLEAPQDAIESIIARHSAVRELVDNGWLHLFRIDDAGGIQRRVPDAARWEAADA